MCIIINSYGIMLKGIMYIMFINSNGKMLLVKLATVLEGDPKASFSLTTTSKCWGGSYSLL